MNVTAATQNISDFDAMCADAIKLISAAQEQAHKSRCAAAQRTLSDARHKLLGAIDEAYHLGESKKPKR